MFGRTNASPEIAHRLVAQRRSESRHGPAARRVHRDRRGSMARLRRPCTAFAAWAVLALVHVMFWAVVADRTMDRVWAR